MDAEIAELVALETDRCRAHVAGDLLAIDAMLAPDLIYVHTTGAVENKEQLAASRQSVRFFRMNRGKLDVQINGDVALMTGLIFFEATVGDDPTRISVEAFASQLLVKRDGKWRYLLHQATRLPSDVSENSRQ